jgi:hypothetical protein
MTDVSDLATENEVLKAEVQRQSGEIARLERGKKASAGEEGDALVYCNSH